MTGRSRTTARELEILALIRKAGPLMDGSFTLTRKKCGNPERRCAQEGPIHPTALLTWKVGGTTHTLCVPVEDREEVAQWVEEGKRIKALKRFSPLRLFVETSPRIKVIATNREGSAEAVLAWYNQRGECSENRIKELKLGLGMERMPCGDFAGNAAFFRLGVLAYNLFVLFRSAALPDTWSRYRLATVRWKLYQAAGNMVLHGNRAWLKIRGWLLELFASIRRRVYAFSLG